MKIGEKLDVYRVNKAQSYTHGQFIKGTYRHGFFKDGYVNPKVLTNGLTENIYLGMFDNDEVTKVGTCTITKLKSS
jgi:hypothetical protein